MGERYRPYPAWMRCETCGHRFKEDECGHYEEVERLLGRPNAIQRFAVCPKCGGEFFDYDDSEGAEDEQE